MRSGAAGAVKRVRCGGGLGVGSVGLDIRGGRGVNMMKTIWGKEGREIRDGGERTCSKCARRKLLKRISKYD